MSIKEDLQGLINDVTNVRTTLEKLDKYKGNQHYKQLLSGYLTTLNRSHIFLKAKIDKATKETGLREKFQTVSNAIAIILSDNGSNAKLKAIKDLESFWPGLEVEFENLEFNIRSFKVPQEIPMADYRLDLEEAIKDFDNGCFISSLVLCRRSYEGALVSVYKSTEKKDPVEDVKCNHCSTKIRDKAYMGIAKLHRWAIDKKIITEKLKQVGFLLTDMGAGAAHPPLAEFPREKEMARLGITATITLLKEIHTEKR